MTICFPTRTDSVVLDGDDLTPSTPPVAQPSEPATDASASVHRSSLPGTTMKIVSRARLVAALAAGVLAPGGHALAQTCAAPAQLSANTVYIFDTCQGETQLQLACGVFPLAGPATVASLDLPYPAGEISIQSQWGGFTPDAFLLRTGCDIDAPCSAAAWINPTGSIDLSSVESGRYFLVVAADATSTIACGPVTITVLLTPEQEALQLDGVFRSGIAPIWQP